MIMLPTMLRLGKRNRDNQMTSIRIIPYSLLFKMEFIRSQFVRAFVGVFVVLTCVELAYKVEGVAMVQRVHTIGDDITLTCYAGATSYNYNSWYRNGTFLANVNGISADDNRITQSYGYDDKSSSYNYHLYIANATLTDSATYKCLDYYNNEMNSYDIRVMGCSSCVLAHHSDPNKEKVVCNLDNYRARERTQINIYVDSIPTPKTAEIVADAFSFAIYQSELDNQLFRFNPYTNRIGNITCPLPTRLPSTQRSTHYPSTSSISTPQQHELTSSYRASHDATSGAPTSTAEQQTRQTKNPNQGKKLSDGDITMIIAISGSVFILVLIILIVVLRFKQKKNQQENKHNGIASIDNKITKEHPEACYESVDDASKGGLQKSTSTKKMKDTSENHPSADHQGGMIDNILYDSSDMIADSLISRTEGPMDNALYAMPDKKRTLNRESKPGVIDGSSDADILYGNSVIISQQEQKRDTLQSGDQYENVEVPGSGGGDGAEEIPLYAMPDKRTQRNTLKATPKDGQTSTLSKEEVVDVDALYAEVDKTKKK